jgi:hypothetical protein
MNMTRRRGPWSSFGSEAEFHRRVQEWVERTTAEQGLPVKVTDPAVVSYVAQILKSARDERRRTEDVG